MCAIFAIAPPLERTFLRYAKDGRVYFHDPKVQNRYFKGDGKNFRYFDIESGRQLKASMEYLKEQINALPLKCQQILVKNKEKRIPLTNEEQSALLKLCSLSISIWGGGPKGVMPCSSMSEYASEFYIQLVRYLTFENKSKWEPGRSKWCSYVKFIRLSTIDALAKQWEKMKPLLVSSSTMPDVVMNRSDEGWEAVQENLDMAVFA
jgi:hypothetical protein